MRRLVRAGEARTDTRNAMTQEVRNGARLVVSTTSLQRRSTGPQSVIGVMGAQFHGVFLNTDTRKKLVNLNTQQLFYTVTQRSFNSPSGQSGFQQQTLDFKNAVFDIAVAVRNKSTSSASNPWGFSGTAADSITGERDDALNTLEFSLSSTPRTLRNLNAAYYRKVYPFMYAETMSDLMGMYYYPYNTQEFMNGTRIVNSYVNASKLDDLRTRYRVNTANYSAAMEDSEVFFFA